MTKSVNLEYFIRFFSEEKYADDFVKGNLYLNTLGYFKGIEQADGRGDPYEGVSHWIQPKDIGLFKLEASNGMNIEMSGSNFSAPLMIQPSYLDKANIFCLYAYGSYLLPKIDKRTAVWSEYEAMTHELFKISEKCRDFGDWAVVIQPRKFMEKIYSNLKFSNREAKFGLVQYYEDSMFSGEFPIIESPFKKQKRFEYQREFRICVYPDNPEFHIARPISLNIGDLSSFTCKTTTEHVIKDFFNIDIKPRA
ncbi:hypothetical protein [Acetobacter okinawensis]|uniref:hypothetical protein n=1 Tax=Acetobacter okinawensis TaxID=1076594 RepID=UPI0039E7F082